MVFRWLANLRLWFERIPKATSKLIFHLLFSVREFMFYIICESTDFSVFRLIRDKMKYSDLFFFYSVYILTWHTIFSHCISVSRHVVFFCKLSSLALTQLHVTSASERLWWQTVMSSVRGHKHFGMPVHTPSQWEERSLWWQGPWMGWFSQSCESTVCVFVLEAQGNIFPTKWVQAHTYTPPGLTVWFKECIMYDRASYTV